MQVGPGEQGVVVEHLLEVGDQPPLVHRVAGESSADLVCHAAGGHCIEGCSDHPGEARIGGGDLPSEESLEAHRLRELGGAAEASPMGIVLLT